MKKTKTNIQCPYITKNLSFSCSACDDGYHPSPFQIEEYCRTESYTKCPFLLETDDSFRGHMVGYMVSSGNCRNSL